MRAVTRAICAFLPVVTLLPGGCRSAPPEPSEPAGLVCEVRTRDGEPVPAARIEVHPRFPPG